MPYGLWLQVATTYIYAFDQRSHKVQKWAGHTLPCCVAIWATVISTTSYRLSKQVALWGLQIATSDALRACQPASYPLAQQHHHMLLTDGPCQLSSVVEGDPGGQGAMPEAGVDSEALVGQGCAVAEAAVACDKDVSAHQAQPCLQH